MANTKVQEAKAKRTVRTNTVVTEKKQEEIPSDAEIVSTDVRTEVEEIENGFLLKKTTETKYKKKGSEYHDWHYKTQTWYSKTDPLEVKLKDEALADAFNE